MAGKKLTIVDQWERFWANVEKTDGCWLWMGAKNGNGYGSMQYDGRICGAHRLMLFWDKKLDSPVYNGDRKQGFVLHSCDNPQCVNPGHLSVGSARKNAVDMLSRGRAERPAGHLHPRALFTPEQIKYIRRSVDTGDLRQVDLAREFKTSRSVIYEIIHRLVYVGPEYE